MKKSLKLTLICITVLMMTCIHFTTMSDNHITYYGVIGESTSNPDTPKVGDTLKYFSSITTGVRGGINTIIPKTIIGCRVTYSFPREIIQTREIFYGFNGEVESDYSEGTWTLTISEASPTSLLRIFEGTAEAVGAGTGKIRMTGTVTTTQGTFDIKVLDTDTPLITIHPALPDPVPAIPIPAEPAQPIATPLPEPVKGVSIPDANLAASVRKALGLGTNATITEQGIKKLTKLDARESQIKNLTGLEHATQLTNLELYKNQIRNVSPLTGLTQLRRLGLDENQINDIRPLSRLTQLEGLYIGGNQINNSGVELLTKFKQLKWLSLYRNKIGNIKPLANLTKLEGLWLTYNQIRDVSPLAGLANLKTLHIEHNSIRDVSPLAELTKLEDLKLGENPIQDMSPLRILLNRNPKLKIDIEIPPLSPVVHLEAAQRPPIYWVGETTGTLHRLVGDEVENLVPTVKNATSLAVDMAGGKLYWTERTGERTGRIRRANLDGTHVKLVKNLTSVPYSTALDTVNGKLYLTNAWGKVQRLNVDGSNFQPNFITGLDTPRNLVLDVAGGKMYWTEMGQKLGRIRRANLDGSSVQYLVGNLTEPLTLAVINGNLYWTNGTRENKGELQHTDLNGFNRKVLETLPIAPTSITFDTEHNSLYLTLPSGGIHRRNLDGSGDEPVVTGLVSPSNIILGITATTPGPTDAPEPPATPVVDTATDVNQDQKVNKTDLLLVVTALGENPPANPNFDVNADGSVNIADVLLVIEALDDPVAAAAPSFGETITSLDPAFLTIQIDILRAESDGSLKYEHAIAFFQGLLASIRPTETRLLANYPNPFNPETWIPYHLANPSHVRITIYDTRGSIVRRLDLGYQREGYYTSRSRAAYWDGRNAVGERVASDVYFYQLQADHLSLLRKMVILK